MNNDKEQIYIEFHSKARVIFFSLVHGFESSIKMVNRRTEEYQFQELKNRYVNTLKQQLEGSANFLIEKYCHLKNPNELNRALQSFIKSYLHLFVQKTRTE